MRFGIAQLDGTGELYYLADGLGSVMALTDDAGMVVATNEYDVYGEVAGSSGSATKPYDFAGEQTDASTGLQYLRARYMDPATGTFISREPLAAAPGWLGNATAYAAGNPVGLVDPTGTVVVELGGGSGGGGFGNGGGGGPSGLPPIGKTFEETLVFIRDAGIDSLADVSYATYYAAYQALEHNGDHYLLTPRMITALLILQGAGLSGDVAIDRLKDLLGTGHGWADEGYVGSVCPDYIEDLLGTECPRTYLPGVHPGLDEDGKPDSFSAGKVDWSWGFPW